MAKRSFPVPIQITSALTISTHVGTAIVSLTNIPTAPPPRATLCAITAKDELLRALRAMEQQNAMVAQELSKVFAIALKPLLDVLPCGAPQIMRPDFGVAKAQPLPRQRKLPSSESGYSSASTYATAHFSIGEGKEPMDLCGPDRDLVEGLVHDVEHLQFSFGKWRVSSTPSTQSPRTRI